jgi:MFS transporter, ACS family, glucarate transporter
LKKRHIVLGFLGTISVITFLDRLAIAVAGPQIQEQLHIRPERWGWVLGAYVLAYGFFEIPSGAMGDRRGRRTELTRIVAWWSAFTALTGWCRNFLQLVSVRFLFGTGAAGAYPNIAGVIAEWFPSRERARAQGVVWAASRLGGAIAPLLIVPLIAHVGWRSVFFLLGVVGFCWAALWRWWFHDSPADQPHITEEELAELQAATPADSAHRGVPWRRLLSMRQLWLISLAYGCYGWGSWFYYSWFPVWMVRGAGFSVAQMGFFAAFPFLMGVVGNLVGGQLSDFLVARIGLRNGYRVITCISLITTALLLLLMAVVHNRRAVVILSTAGFGVMDLMLPAAWAMCVLIGGRYGGTATGIMNTAGNLGGLSCTLLFGYAVRAFGSYNVPVYAVAAMVFVSAILFARVDCSQGMVDQRSAA